MKTNQFGLPGVVVLALFALTGCGAVGTKVTPGNNLVQLPHFSFRAPDSGDWSLQTRKAPAELARLTKRKPAYTWSILVAKNDILDEATRRKSARQIADDYRTREKSRMELEPLMGGQYSLEYAKMGEETIGGKKFYTMSYKTVSSQSEGRGRLYLHFPSAGPHDYFVLCLYMDGGPPGSGAPSHVPQAQRILQSLRIRQP